MRLNQNKMKMLVFMAWLVDSHQKLLDIGEDEIPQEEDADHQYNNLYLCCKKHLKEAGNLAEYENFNSIAQKLNNQIDKTKRKLFERMGDGGCTLMMLIVGALRHCNIGNLRGFDDLKEIDLDAIIARAREEKYLNKWCVQSLCRDFKFGYWEA